MTATVTVLGIDGRDIPAGAVQLIVGAHLLVGPQSLLDVCLACAEVSGAAEQSRTIEVCGTRTLGAEVLASLAESVRAGESAVVVVPGDPGYFGVLRQLREHGLPAACWPATSLVQRLAARLARPWDDLCVVSAVGSNFRRAVNMCRARRAVAVLTAPGAGPAELGAELDGWRRSLVVLEDCGGPDERLSVVDAHAASARDWFQPDVLLCLADLDEVGRDSWLGGGDLVPPPDGWVLEEDRFARRDGVECAPEVRAVVLAKLAPSPGSLLWDVYAGSGVVAVEAARMGAAVIAAEADQGLCVRIVANTSAHGVDVRLVDGDLPGALVGLPKPDAVHVAAARPDVVRRCAAVGAQRIVVAVHELEGLGPARDALADAGYLVDGCQLSAARLEGLAGGGAAVGPAASMFLLWGQCR